MKTAVALNIDFNRDLAPGRPTATKGPHVFVPKKHLLFPLLIFHTSETNLERLLCALLSDAIHKEACKFLEIVGAAEFRRKGRQTVLFMSNL